MQGKRRLLALVSGASLLAVATPALAILSVPYGWYLEGNAGSTQLSNKSYPGNPSSSGIGGNANIGYKFMPYFTTEIGYTLYANTVVKDSNNTKAVTDKHYSYDVAFKGIFPVVDSGLEFFGKLGVDRQNSAVSVNNSTSAVNLGLSSGQHSAVGIYFGGGAQYYFIPELAVNMMWVRAQGNSSTGNLDLLSGGLSFIFD